MLAASLFVLPQAHAAEPVTVALVSRTLFNMPAWVAERKGYLKEAGYEFRLKLTPTADDLNVGLRSGAYQLSISPPETLIVDGAKGSPAAVVVGGNASKLPHYIIAKPSIRSLSQLRGAHFGVYSNDEGTTYLLADIAKAAGFAPGDYTVTAVGGAPARWELLKAGKIDVALQPFPLSYEAEAAGYTNLGPMLAIVPDWQFTTVNANAAWARQNPKVVSAFLGALRKGQAAMEANPEETAQIAAQELRSDVGLARRALADAARNRILDVEISGPGLARMFDVLQGAGQIPRGRKFELRDFADTSFLDASRK
ncbi:MAG TPA: ABC transporter substrate-binding protein [Ramlibacter sp.]|nr:ABC transporter substrate-binding protein [Ramlibacter sp.]